jgi:hypothetical protein
MTTTMMLMMMMMVRQMMMMMMIMVLTRKLVGSQPLKAQRLGLSDNRVPAEAERTAADCIERGSCNRWNECSLGGRDDGGHHGEVGSLRRGATSV